MPRPEKPSIRRASRGVYRRIKWIVLCVTLGIYYLLPFVRWDRGPNEPHQAVLVDLAHRRFYFFFIEIWPQEVYYLTGLLILAAMTLFLLNALAGRVWCGYLCPQTVWTDLFFAVERWSKATGASACTRTAALDGPARPREGAETRDLARDRLVDRRRLGALFRRRADPGRPARHAPGARDRLDLDRHPDVHDLCPRRLHARAGLRLHVSVAAHPGRDDRRERAQRHLPARSRRTAHVAEEGDRRARARRAGGRLHRLQPMRRTSVRPASTSATGPISAASSADCASTPATR